MVVNACSFTLKPGDVYMVRLYCSHGGYTLRHKNTLRRKRPGIMFFMVGQTGGNSLAFLYFFLYGSAGGSNAALRAVLMRLCGRL